MKPVYWFCIALMCACSLHRPAERKPADLAPALRLESIAPGVFVTQFANARAAAGTGNVVVIVTDLDVLVVDAMGTPAGARSLIREIRRVTPKPVRYIVNTHWHGDHHFGNQAFLEAYPSVEFISHPNTRADIVAEEVPGLEKYVREGLPTEIADYERRLSGGRTSSGALFTSQQRASLTAAVAEDRWLLNELRSVKPTLATITVADSLVVHRGRKTILIRYLGRGNTRGDLTVYLPDERILAVGDLLVHPMPYAVGSYPTEWVRTLERVEATGARILVPGHGAVQPDLNYVVRVRTLLQSTLSQVQSAVAAGLDLETTFQYVKLDSMRAVFTNGDASRNNVFDANYTRPAVERAWKEAMEAKRPR